MHHTAHTLSGVQSYAYFHRFNVFAWTGENDSSTLDVDAYFFEGGEEKSPFPKITGYM